MFLTTHAAIGLIAAQKLKNPGIAFLIGLALHYIADIIPHGDEEIAERGRDIGNRDMKVILWTLIDAGFVLLLIYAFIIDIFPGDRTVLAMGVLGGILPDVLTNIYVEINKRIEIKKLKNYFLLRPIQSVLKFHLLIHNWFHQLLHKQVKLKHGLVTQFIILLIIIGLEFKFFF